MKTTKDVALEKAEIEGFVEFLYSNKYPEHKCKCCPEGRHAHHRYVKFPTIQSDYPKHFARDANMFVHSTACQHKYVGKRVRVTVEVLE